VSERKNNKIKNETKGKEKRKIEVTVRWLQESPFQPGIHPRQVPLTI
jgi:hypothetical protein